MTIEAAQNISELNTSYPRATDLLKEGDDHIRLIKANLKRTFPRIAGITNISHDTLNNLDNNITAASNGVTFKTLTTFPDIHTDLISVTNTATLKNITLSQGGAFRIFSPGNQQEMNLSVPPADYAKVIVNRSAGMRQWDWNGTDVINASHLGVSGTIDTTGPVVARVTSDPAGSTGQYLNTNEFRSGFRARGNDGTTPYAYVSFYGQEHVGTDFSAIIQLVGFANNSAWHFRQGGIFNTPSLNVDSNATINGSINVGGNTQLGGNLRINWGGRGVTYQENGDIVEQQGGAAIFHSVNNSNNLSGALSYLNGKMNDLFLGGHQVVHYGEQRANWSIPSGGCVTGINQMTPQTNPGSFAWIEDLYWRNMWKTFNGVNSLVGMQ